jgi:hypothetical protein
VSLKTPEDLNDLFEAEMLDEVLSEKSFSSNPSPVKTLPMQAMEITKGLWLSLFSGSCPECEWKLAITLNVTQ